MRRMLYPLAVLVACVVLTSHVYGLGVSEYFGGYTSYTPWQYVINSNWPDVGGYFAYTTDTYNPGNPAAYFTLTIGGSDPYASLTPDAANSVWFMTDVLNSSIRADFINASADVTNNLVPSSAIAVNYFLAVDDSGTDRYYMTTSPIDAAVYDPNIFEYRELRSLTDGSASWQLYDMDGTAVGSPVSYLGSAITDNMWGLGVRFDVDLTDPDIPDTGTVTFYVDYVTTPEPGALMLACFGAVGILLRRKRRA